MFRRLRTLLTYTLLAVVIWFVFTSWQSQKHVNILTSVQVVEIQRYDLSRQSELDILWRRINSATLKHAPEFNRKNAPLANVEGINQLETQLGYQIPGELRALLLSEHISSHSLGSYELYTPPQIHGNWEMYLEIAAGYLQSPITPSPDDCDPFWHPGWIPFGGWDAYELIINLETGEVYSYNDPGVRWEADSLTHWLTNVADRLERDAAPKGFESVFEWIDSDFPTPGSSKSWSEL